MAKALGADSESEPAENTHLLTPHLAGAIGLLFSPRDLPAIKAYFSSFRPLDFARAGTIANRSFTIPAGIVYSLGGEIPAEEDVPLAPSMEPTLRKLGVPSTLGKGRELGGKTILENDYQVCKLGEKLGSGQTTLLKMFGIASAEFKVDLRAYWTAATGTVETIEDDAIDGGMDVDV